MAWPGLSRTRQGQRRYSQPERRFCRVAVFDPPVLVVDPLVLSLVEPHNPERVVLAHPGEQVADLDELAGLGPHRGLGQQHRLVGERPHLVNGAAEYPGECVGRKVVVAVDADPGDIICAGPPGGDRPVIGAVRVDCPQPGDILGTFVTEQRHDVLPGRDERRCGDVPIAPRVPGGVHLVPEADDDRVAEVPHAVGIGAHVAVVVTGGDRRYRGEGGVDLHEWDDPVGADPLRERCRERLRPAAEVPDEVRLGVCRLREFRDRFVRGWRSDLIDAKVGGRAGRQGRVCGRRAGRDQGDPAAREGAGGRGDHDGQEHYQAGSHALLSPGKMTRLTMARLSKPKNNRTANAKEPSVTVRQMASTAQSRAVPPLHPATPIRKRRSALPGVLDGCQPIVLPRMPSQMAKTWAQPRAIPSAHTDGPYSARCHNGYRTSPVSMAGRRMMKFRSWIWLARKASMTMGIVGPKNVSRPV